MRYERKFIFENTRFQQDRVTSLILANDFHKPFLDRKVNSIYFMDREFKDIDDHQNGELTRSKLRFRWYGNSIGHVSVTAEIKIRSGDLGTKEQLPIGTFESFDFNSKQILEMKLRLASELEKKGISSRVIEQDFPLLFVRYKRQYFQQRLSTFRITVDENIQYSKLGLGSFFLNEPNGVLEMKFHKESVENVHKIISNLGLVQMKNSKLMNGFFMLY